MQLDILASEGGPLSLECEDTFVSAWVAKSILVGTTYPHLPFLDDVRVVFDVGANCGAAAVHFARHHPSATVHAFEPAAAVRAILERNAAAWPNVVVHPFGLFDRDTHAALYHGAESIMASVHHRSVNADESEDVQLRDAGPWAASEGIERVDVLKVDVEGCEAEVLRSLQPLLPTVQVLYVEYDSRVARREIDQLLAPTHDLWFARLLALDQGECIYLSSSLVDRPEAREHLIALYGEGMGLEKPVQDGA